MHTDLSYTQNTDQGASPAGLDYVGLSPISLASIDLDADILADETGIDRVDTSSHSGTDQELCVICGDRASGYHYNAFSCEGCKGFFRRSVARGLTYECKYGGNCEMDMWMRRRCQACRLRRCREVGMKEECLMSAEQCKARDVRRKFKRRMRGSNEEVEAPCVPSVTSEESSCSLSPLEHMSSEHKDLIQRLVMYQDRFEVPSADDIQKLSFVKLDESAWPKDMANAIFKHMAEMTILVTHLVVEMAKRLPGFMQLERDDQIVLLKGSASEVMMLRTARRYDPLSDTVVFGDGTPFTRTAMKFGGLQEYVDDMFDFARRMSLLAVDNAEYALLTAICIFSDRCGIANEQQTESIQEMYIKVLTAYVKLRRPLHKTFLAHLLHKLVDLRTLGLKHSDALLALRVQKGSLPPLLEEYFE